MSHLKALSGSAFDAAFLSGMIEHHQGALEMSQSYLKEGKRPELKAVARAIVQDQKREIGQMAEWTREWTGQEPDPELRRQMKAEMMPMMSAFEADCRSDCDRAFLVHMRMHHQMAVEMARMVPERSSRPELKRLADQIIASQTAEMGKFDAWLKEWYPEAGHSGSGH